MHYQGAMEMWSVLWRAEDWGANYISKSTDVRGWFRLTETNNPKGWGLIWSISSLSTPISFHPSHIITPSYFFTLIPQAINVKEWYYLLTLYLRCLLVGRPIFTQLEAAYQWNRLVSRCLPGPASVFIVSLTSWSWLSTRNGAMLVVSTITASRQLSEIFIKDHQMIE